MSCADVYEPAARRPEAGSSAGRPRDEGTGGPARSGTPPTTGRPTRRRPGHGTRPPRAGVCRWSCSSTRRPSCPSSCRWHRRPRCWNASLSPWPRFSPDHGASPAFIAAEEGDDRVASRQDRQPQRRRHHERVRLPRRCVSEGGGPPSLLELSVRLAQTPCGPLYKRHLSPDRELTALLGGQQRPTARRPTPDGYGGPGERSVRAIRFRNPAVNRRDGRPGHDPARANHARVMDVLDLPPA